MHIYLVRHTAYSNPHNVFGFHLPFNLSEEGREHAKRIANWFSTNATSHLPIYASPMVRCIQTAEIIAAQTQSFVECDPRLIESSCPELQGTKLPEVASWKLEEDHPSRESRDSIQKRMISIYTEKVEKKENAVLVSHGDPLTILYYYLTKEESPRYFWDPANSDKVVNRGEIVDVEIFDSRIKSITKHQV